MALQQSTSVNRGGEPLDSHELQASTLVVAAFSLQPDECGNEYRPMLMGRLIR